MPRHIPGDEADHLEFDDNRLMAALCGSADSHLAVVEAATGARLDPRGNRLTISASPPETRRRVAQALLSVYGDLENGAPVGPAEIRAALRLQGGAEPGANGAALGGGVTPIRVKKRTVAPRTPNQAAYIAALRNYELTFGVGPAGTGKTYLAVAHALELLLADKVERLILSRPAVEAGEQIGFLPGDMKEKVDPYMRPIYDALYDMAPAEWIEKRVHAGVIEIAPLAFMRGRTLARAAVILDEAQNATPAQMKMFLTRLGEGAAMTVTGDPSQTDLAAGQRSGLVDALDTLDGVEGVAAVRFAGRDVVRHPLVGRIIDAYDRRVASDGANDP
ncbi:MAG: PhoH family protein [Pseudomonadota bacterium]